MDENHTYNISNTLLFSSTLDSSHICDRLNASFNRKDVKARFNVKTIQDLDAEAHFDLVRVHAHNCPLGVEGMLDMLMNTEEEILAKNNSDYNYLGHDLLQMQVHMSGFCNLQVIKKSTVVNIKHDLS